jgi:hypothetical protein
MYGKLFQSMYEGTLYGQWQAIVTLQQMVILADEDGVVDMTPPAIAAKTSVPLDIIEKGIGRLLQPDAAARYDFQRGGHIKSFGSGYTIVGFDRLIYGKRPKPGEWARLRSSVFERDNYTCQYCGQRGGKLECDHVVPVSRGGGNDEDNLATACLPCNRSKRNKTPEEWQGRDNA